MFYAGLDLGQARDFSALAIIESMAPTETRHTELHLRHLERYPLGTPYPDVVQRVASLLSDGRLYSEGRAPRLAVDSTGVGVAVTDLLDQLGIRFAGVTITGGQDLRYQDGTWRVPKRDLVTALAVPFQTGRLRVAQGLMLWPVLKAELLAFRRRIDKDTGHDSYRHWRDTDHDDLVLACALACWDASRRVRHLQVLEGGSLS